VAQFIIGNRQAQKHF